MRAYFKALHRLSKGVDKVPPCSTLKTNERTYSSNGHTAAFKTLRHINCFIPKLTVKKQ